MQNVERLISVFKKDDDALVDEINVDHLGFEKLRSVLNPSDDDKEMYDVYPIDSTKASQLKGLLDIKFDFNTYIYQLDCFAKK